ncbi:MAG: ABC transporter ATP-binding protein [Acidobacteriota bacterium]
MGAVFVRLIDVTKRFGTRSVVHRLSLEVLTGEVIALLGASGCGKTTTLRLIAGLETPDEGEIWLGDRCVAVAARNLVPPSDRGIGFVFQDLALWPHLTVTGNLDFMLASTKLPKKARLSRIAETLQLMRIERFIYSYPGKLSGGEQQRVALARAIVNHPNLLLLDESMSNLDSQLKLELRKELIALQRALGITTIHVTHDPIEAKAVAHRIAIMHQGRIEQIDKTEVLQKQPSSEIVSRLMQPEFDNT